MVDYEINGGKVTNFKMVVADWGSANFRFTGQEFFGGTPVYSGPLIYNHRCKDMFSFGRLAMELMMDKSGTESKIQIDFICQKFWN